MTQKRSTVFHRAWTNTTSWICTSLIALMLGAFIQLFCGLLAFHFISVNANLGDKIFYGTISVSIGLILLFGLSYLIQLESELKNKPESDKEAIAIAQVELMKDMIQAHEKEIKHFGETVIQIYRLAFQNSEQPNATRSMDRSIEITRKTSVRQIETELKNKEQPNAVSRMDKPIGITETRTGKPAFLVPIDNAQTLSNIPMGSPQTFTGLNIDESPIFISIPRIGYVLIMIAFINNDKVEVKFMVDTKTELPYRTATVALVIESQAVSLLIPAGPNRFFSQVSEVTIDKWQGAASIQIETSMIV